MALSTKPRLSSLEKKNGVVYTPSNLAAFVADKVIGYWIEENYNAKGLKIIDPACGEGELLFAALQTVRKSSRRFAQLDPSSILCGVDLSELAVATSVNKLQSLSSSSRDSNFLVTNALFPENQRHQVHDWPSLKKLFGAEKGFDVLIANPPWGADTSSYKEKLNRGNYSLSKGQFDTSDLFVELALSAVKDGGYFAFILPDSLFGFERKDLRQLLAEKSEIKYIGRLGEKIFEGINRACVILIGKKVVPNKANKVSCMRLNPSIRGQILDGTLSYAEADKMLSHEVKQTRFLETENFLFDIDTKEEEKNVVDKITKAGKLIGEYVSSSRGVELSKTGKICKCSFCGYWTPLPTNEKPVCPHCKAVIDLTTAELSTIISKKRFKGSKPLLVGESVQRYSISSRYWIALDNKGINYKNISIYYEPKILVRKTGVGITATIDYSNSMTNQVVYMFRPHSEGEIVPIEFILAVMNSRALYYYLLKTYGETEWRSHPYLTQSQILNLPLPSLNKGIQTKIVNLLKPYLEKHENLPQEVDAKVEYLIATLFELSKKDYEVIYRAINDTQGLIPVKKLLSVAVEDIFGVQR